MPKLFNLPKDFGLPFVVIFIGFFIGLVHLFSYMIPFTNNAFVATNVTPVAADVSGYVTKIYVKNGQQVKKNDPLIRVYQKPYQLEYQAAKAKYEAAIERIGVIQKQTQKSNELLKAAVYNYEKAKIEYLYRDRIQVREAVPKLTRKTLEYNLQVKEKTKNAFIKQIAIEDQQIREQMKRVEMLKADMEHAKVNLDLTIVRAPADGYVDNLFIATGTPIKIHTPLFSFIDTSKWWIQANFDETDLRRIRPGDEAIIVLRMYYFRKIFHGRIVNAIWVADRQKTASRSQQQRVTNENQWLLIPQRLPLQIEITDPDPSYPLQPGASAYVYLKAHTHP